MKSEAVLLSFVLASAEQASAASFRSQQSFLG